MPLGAGTSNRLAALILANVTRARCFPRNTGSQLPLSQAIMNPDDDFKGCARMDATELCGNLNTALSNGPAIVREHYVDAVEGAAFLGVHPKTLMRWAREGRVPAYQSGEGTQRRHWRFLISDLDNFMKSRINSTPHPVRPCPAKERSK